MRVDLLDKAAADEVLDVGLHDADDVTPRGARVARHPPRVALLETVGMGVWLK